MIRVWFNHWFSTSYRLIELMKENEGEPVWVVGTNAQCHSVIQNVCDEWYSEPDTEGDAYVEDCLRFCREHEIDVFVPRRKMQDISRNKERFQEIGVKVLTEDYSKMKLLADKAGTYELFRAQEDLIIPEYRIVNTAEEFERAYRELHPKYGQVCVKFVVDEGGMSFRKIAEEENPYHMLRMYAGSAVPLKWYREWLKAIEPFDSLMVMPYLPGTEISVDCLSTSSGLIAIPRYKGAARHEEIIYDERILHMTACIMETAKLEYPCNIQFKLKDDVPYLLEINTRMSGGLQMSCMAAGVNIPNIALNKLLGKEIPWRLEKKNRIVSYIEIPQIVM
ncbi:MAG: ATP-grasp domain-containing protein [Candidatus Gastranaerophilales bacterium]|nr:ATP-grasp domain-containing protein [Candidatus Gastranaerophilales bacterium]